MRSSGEAMVAWEQSAWLNPFDRAACDNLLYAQETMLIKSTGSDTIRTGLDVAAGQLLDVDCRLQLVAGGRADDIAGIFRLRKTGWHQSLAALALGIFF